MSARVKLKELLLNHENSQASNSLKLSIGDGFLIKHSFIFRNIRNETLKLGFSYTNEDFCHYNVMPYLSLPAILRDKRIPFFDNVTVLFDIEEKLPNRFFCDEIPMIKPNYCLHESSHCIADSVLQNISFEPEFFSAEQAQVFKLIMAESFANSVESLTNLTNTCGSQKLFFDLNSYVTHDDETEVFFRKAKDLLGFEYLYGVVYASYILSNCLQPYADPRKLASILQQLIPDSSLLKKANESSAVRKVFDHSLDLGIDFREHTTEFFCAMMGTKTKVRKLLNIDLSQLLKETNILQTFINSTRHFFTLKNQDSQ